MQLVGLTGNIGSGKSLVAQLLEQMGAQILDADDLAKAVVQPGQPAWQQLQQEFGPEYFDAAGQLLRPKMAELVFAQPEQLKTLNLIVHSAITLERIRHTTAIYEQHPQALLVYVVPLLFENQMEKQFQKILLVTLDEATRLDRLTRFRGFTPEQVQARLKNQIPQAEKLHRADYVIDNSQSVEATQAQLHHLWPELVALPQLPLERVLP